MTTPPLQLPETVETAKVQPGDIVVLRTSSWAERSSEAAHLIHNATGALVLMLDEDTDLEGVIRQADLRDWLTGGG